MDCGEVLLVDFLQPLLGTSGDVKDLQNSSFKYSYESDKVQAVVDQKGPINFSTIPQQLQNDTGEYNIVNLTESQHLAELLFGQNISTIPNIVENANPETYINNDTPPFFIEHGTNDTLIPYQQSVDFTNKLRNVLGNNKVILILVPNEGHNYTFSAPNEVNTIFKFFDSNLK